MLNFADEEVKPVEIPISDNESETLVISVAAFARAARPGSADEAYRQGLGVRLAEAFEQRYGWAPGYWERTIRGIKNVKIT